MTKTNPRAKTAPKTASKTAPQAEDKPPRKPRAKRGKAAKEPINLNLPSNLIALAEGYAEANGRKLSTLVEDLLRRHLDDRGIPTDIPLEELAKRLSVKTGRQISVL